MELQFCGPLWYWRWTTSLFPKNGLYLVPLKDASRKAEQLKEGDEVTIRLEICR